MSDEKWLDAVCSNVSSKELTAKASGRKFRLYTVETDMGQFTTAKRDLAEEAFGLRGRKARFLVKTEQRGDFTNYYLEDVGPLDQFSPAPPQQAQAPAAFEPAPPPPQQAPVPVVQQSPVVQQDAKDERIHRQVAAKVSAHLSKTPEEFWSNLDDLVAFFASGTKPNRMAAAAATTVAAPDMSGGVSSTIPDSFYANTDVDSDIPF